MGFTKIVGICSTIFDVGNTTAGKPSTTSHTTLDGGINTVVAGRPSTTGCTIQNIYQNVLADTLNTFCSSITKVCNTRVGTLSTILDV